jgi:hypothetical protein
MIKFSIFKRPITPIIGDGILNVAVIFSGAGLWWCVNQPEVFESGIFTHESSIPTVDTSKWKIYINTNIEGGFSIKIPSDWQVIPPPFKRPLWHFQSTSRFIGDNSNNFPDKGNLWINIAGVCEVDGGYDFSVWNNQTVQKTVCKSNLKINPNEFEINLGLWNTDPDVSSRKEILNAILDSFQILPIKDEQK